MIMINIDGLWMLNIELNISRGSLIYSGNEVSNEIDQFVLIIVWP